MYRITVQSGDLAESRFAKLRPPRAFSIGQDGRDPE